MELLPGPIRVINESHEGHCLLLAQELYLVPHGDDAAKIHLCQVRSFSLGNLGEVRSSLSAARRAMFLRTVVVLLAVSLHLHRSCVVFDLDLCMARRLHGPPNQRLSSVAVVQCFLRLTLMGVTGSHDDEPDQR